jgi:hypothetical protein
MQDTRDNIMNQSELQTVEIEEAAARELVELQNALIALEKNKHFRSLVKSIFEDIPLTVAAQWNNHIDAAPSQQEGMKKKLEIELSFVSSFRKHLSFIHASGNQGRRKLEQLEEYRLQREVEVSAE